MKFLEIIYFVLWNCCLGWSLEYLYHILFRICSTMTESENTRNILTQSFRIQDNDMELINLNDVQRQTSRDSIR